MGAESTRIDPLGQDHDRRAFEPYIVSVMIRTILHYPDKRLREKGAAVPKITPAIQALVDDMAETMYAAPGVGLAATQIGERLQVFVIDVATEDEPSDLRVFINPEILERHDQIVWSEGCLSFPGINEEVERAAKVKVRAKDREGRTFELEAEGLLAVAIQHEHDHLQGVLMIDHLGPLKKRLVSRKMQKRADADAGP
jgi:peptide deformylase